jgi:hypothetical protein
MDIKSSIISAASDIDGTCSAPTTFGGSILIIVICCIFGLFWALHNYRLVK